MRVFPFYFFRRIPCYFGVHNLAVDTKTLKGFCRRCHWLFDVSYDMTYGETRIERKVDCGEYFCVVDDTYGFVPEDGCPIYDAPENKKGPPTQTN
jgi:hypothetical protein